MKSSSRRAATVTDAQFDDYVSLDGNVVPIQDILLQLWGDDSYFNTRSLHVFITKLRHKLSADTSIRIINVRGVGYKLVGGMTTT